jgi:hypothetical protein
MKALLLPFFILYRVLGRDCVISVRVGDSPQAGWIPQSPWSTSFFFVSNATHLDAIQAKGWVPVWLTLPNLGLGPTRVPSLLWSASDLENLHAKYAKILSHRLLPDCDRVLYMDSKLEYTKETVREIFGYAHPCVTLFRHPWRSYEGAYMQEVADSYHQERYLRFKSAIERQIKDHGTESLDGVMHLGGTHVTNLRNAEAIHFQEAWWNETIAYSIQDQLSLFWQLQPFRECIQSWHPMYGPTKHFIVRFFENLLH